MNSLLILCYNNIYNLYKTVYFMTRISLSKSINFDYCMLLFYLTSHNPHDIPKYIYVTYWFFLPKEKHKNTSLIILFYD
jgi:hypothetical protein